MFVLLMEPKFSARNLPVVALTVATAVLLDVNVTAPRDSDVGLPIAGPTSPKVLESSAMAESTGVPFRTVRTKFFDAARKSSLAG